jgi:predicted nucleic acid-binding protein
MNNKKADNLSYDKKKSINDLDNKIYDNKKKMNELVKIQETLISIDVSINECINKLSRSMKRDKDSIIYSDMQDTNRKNLFESLDLIEKDISTLKDNIEELRVKKEEIKEEKDEENK